MKAPLISICIPAYERVGYLKRLLESIQSQTFRDFEVVVSDDSRNEDVRNLVSEYESRFPVVYQRNDPSLGTPKNWNKAIEKANGAWIKLMHDDDWFSTETALADFAEATKAGIDFIWCFYSAAYDSGKVVNMSHYSNTDVSKNPYRLFVKNIIGPPSSMMIKREKALAYDGRLKWLVDIDYFIEKIKENGAFVIKKWLINFGYNDSQVTNSCYLNRQVEIPESLILYEKHGSNLTRTISLYDAWWRLMRNLEIRDISEVEEFKGPYEIPPFLVQIVERQKWIPTKLLQFGPVSQLFMTISFLTGRK